MNLIYGKSLKFSKIIDIDEMQYIEDCISKRKILPILFEGLIELDQNDEIISFTKKKKNIKTYAIVGSEYLFNAMFEKRADCIKFDLCMSFNAENINRNSLVNNFLKLNNL